MRDVEKHPDGKQHHPRVATDRDPSIPLVPKRRNQVASEVYHAYSNGNQPACGRGTEEYTKWPMLRAVIWRRPCSICYPDGHDVYDAYHDPDQTSRLEADDD